MALFLAVLTGIEIATYAAPGFPAWSWGDKAGLITVLLILMAVKFWTVAYFFMHLRFDKPLLTRVFYAGCCWPWWSTWPSCRCSCCGSPGVTDPVIP